MTPPCVFPQLVRDGRKLRRGHFRETVVVDDGSAIHLTASDNVAGCRLIDIWTADAVCQVRRGVERSAYLLIRR